MPFMNVIHIELKWGTVKQNGMMLTEADYFEEIPSRKKPVLTHETVEVELLTQTKRFPHASLIQGYKVRSDVSGCENSLNNDVRISEKKRIFFRKIINLYETGKKKLEMTLLQKVVPIK